MGIVLNLDKYKLIFELKTAVKNGKKGLVIIGNLATTYENAIKLLTKEIKND